MWSRSCGDNVPRQGDENGVCKVIPKEIYYSLTNIEDIIKLFGNVGLCGIWKNCYLTSDMNFEFWSLINEHNEM